MANIGLAYELIAVATNKTPRADEPLWSAEDNSREYVAARLSSLGPASPERTQHLVGRHATRAALDAAFRNAIERGVEYLEFAADCHGNGEALGLADGSYRFDSLRHWFAKSRARCVLNTINSCGAGGLLKEAKVTIGAVSPTALRRGWNAGLVRATSGTYDLVACASDAKTFDTFGQGMIFRKSLLAAMAAPVPGDLNYGDISMRSARRILEDAAARMKAAGCYPIYRGPDATAHFPMAVSNFAPIGILAIGVEGSATSALLSVRISGRQLLRTKIVVSSYDALGVPLRDYEFALMPGRSDEIHRYPLSVDLRDGLASRWDLEASGGATLRWDVAMYDQNARLVDTARTFARH